MEQDGIVGLHNSFIRVFVSVFLLASVCHVYAVSEQDETVVAYQQNIKELELESGVYDVKLGEQLLSLGLIYQAKNDHEKALSVLDRALQIKRINQGLYETSQIPILEKLLISNFANGDWKSVDKNYQQILWIHKRGYDYNAPELLTVTDKVGRWKLAAYKQELLKENSSALLFEAEDLYDDVISHLSSIHGDMSPYLIRLLYGQAQTNYEIAFYLLSQPLNSDAQESRIFNINRHLSKAGQMLKKIVSIYETKPELNKKDYANALVHLGDWNLLRERRKSAHRLYNKAYTTLDNDTDNKEHLDSLFATPSAIPAIQVGLPEFGEFQKNINEHKGNNNQKDVLVSFDVSRKGRARNIKVLKIVPKESIRTARTAKKSVKFQQYRPRYENGEPVSTYDYQMNFVLMDKK